MPVIKLDAAAVLAIRTTPREKKETFFDEAITGFVVEAQPSGSATYALRYKNGYGRQRQHKIANVADITFAEAKREAARVKGRVAVGRDPVEERKAIRSIPTFEELADRYMDFVRANKKSHAIDEQWLRLHLRPRFGKLHLDQIRQEEVVEWLASKVRAGYAPASANRLHVIMGHMYRLAKQWGVPGAEKNPLDGVKQRDPGNKLERFLTPAETQRLKEAVEASPNPMLKYIVALLLLTGARKQELLKAKWADFDLDRKAWLIPTSKTGKPRRVPLSDDAIAVLKQVPRIDGCPYVAPNPKTKKPITGFYNSWNSARKAAGVPDCRVHDLRHSHASNLVNAGQSLYVVSKVLGHSNIRTSERYAHLDSGVLLKAVNAAAQVTGTTWGDD